MKANENEILTIAGTRVRVVYSDNNNECCCNCLWDNKCLEAPERPAIYCRRYDKDGKYAYFVPADDTEAAPGAPLAFEHRILGRADISSCCD